MISFALAWVLVTAFENAESIEVSLLHLFLIVGMLDVLMVVGGIAFWRMPKFDSDNTGSKGG